MKIQVSTQQMKLLETFASESRVRMIELLDKRPMNVKELAEALGISSAIVTKHVQKLEDVGIIRTESLSGTRGRQKVCHLQLDSVTLQLRSPAPPVANRYSTSIPIGQYSDYRVQPTCGLASRSQIIGMVDDPRYFSDPERMKASHLWFGSGYVEYRIPNYLLSNQRPRGISISLELCSEAPGFNENWPSDIYFHLNEVCLGYWTCPGDFGRRRGVHTPDWWNYGTQYGLLKTVRLQPDGAYIDGTRMSDVSIRDVPIPFGADIRFRISAPDTAKNRGGLSLFGRQFGNYDQDIEVAIQYEDA
ncbi:transcriptional regulator [Cohnella xylanilytica]|uniref:ArsR family transcriptional regulator n=1 Tax=Cohnella xylanilytica TaxID=557555 RepID=A0A841U5G7_9BACL|nr:helix-turn-helix domain-containing protein [Cohnella xylanilytica]MBB6694852.1 ArsR family transcriptional regulator [Cohnella xylanilytica]GIO16344.1 transcriptional regulator [Cohnella xylanilytica]